ncbi:hypothetical protein NQ641_02725 [Acinetobacter baumannii]|nr:hypothetical protein [Acinetobacter baumannii]
MIDLKQELEDFDAYFFKRHGELPLDPSSEEYANKSYLKHEMFKAWKARAKAQAVPDTHIVVPKQPTPKMIDATWDFDDEIIEMSSNTRNEFIWKKMVEASESGAEQ